LEHKRRDRLDIGENVKGFREDPSSSLGFFKKSFLLFRGTQAKAKWIKDWEKRVIIETTSGSAQNIKLHGNITASLNVTTALRLAVPQSPTAKPVLFTISMRNHRGYSGFRLNKPQYSAHHYE